MNKLKTKEKIILGGSLKCVILYTYIFKKLLRLKNAMSCGTWTNISFKVLLATPPRGFY
jgi:hypothetical protein